MKIGRPQYSVMRVINHRKFRIRFIDVMDEGSAS
jgi:hypothetical protein